VHGRTSILPNLIVLPLETLQNFISNYLLSSSSDAARFTTALAITSLSETRSLDLNISFMLSPTDPTEICVNFIPSLGSCLSEIVSSSVSFNDDFLIALAGSSVSQTLRKLDISHGYISDDSVPAWKHFTALEALKIWNCHFITFKTLLEVALLPNLRLLDSNLELSDQLPELLEAPRLPTIQHLALSLPDFYPNAEDAPLILQRLGRLSTLTIFDLRFKPDTSGFFYEIMKVLPNLTKPPGAMRCDFAAFRGLAQSCASLDALSCGPKELKVDNQVELDDLGSMIPRLSSVYFTAASDQKFDFSKLSSLTSLTFKAPSMHKCVALPPSLTSLSLFEGTSGQVKSVPFDDVVDRITHLTALKDLRIQFWTTIVTPQHIATLTARLTNLTTLMVQNSAPSPPAPGSICFSASPFISNIISDNCKVLLDPSSAYLPSLRSIPRPCGLKFDSLKPEQLPNLDCISDLAINNSDESVSTAAFLQRFAKQLRDLTVASANLGRLPSLTHLNRLKIRPAIPEPNAAQFIKLIPNLTALELTISCSKLLDHFEWVSHKNVVQLRLTYEQAYVEPNVRRPDFIISAQSLPRLRSLTLSLASRPVELVSISSLNFLVDVDVKVFVGRQMSLIMQGCPFLWKASIEGATFTSFKLNDMKHLSLLYVTNCSMEKKQRKKTVEGCDRLVDVVVWTRAATTTGQVMPVSKWIHEPS
jgi:hypothetical protein